MQQRAAGSIVGAVPRTPTPQQSTPSECCYHADPRPSRGCNLGFAEQGAVWHHGVIGPSSFISTVPLTGPIRVERVPLIASSSTSNARSHTALQGPCCPYLLWMTLEERRWEWNLVRLCALYTGIKFMWYCLQMSSWIRFRAVDSTCMACYDKQCKSSQNSH